MNKTPQEYIQELTARIDILRHLISRKTKDPSNPGIPEDLQGELLASIGLRSKLRKLIK